MAAPPELCSAPSYTQLTRAWNGDYAMVREGLTSTEKAPTQFKILLTHYAKQAVSRHEIGTPAQRW